MSQYQAENMREACEKATIPAEIEKRVDELLELCQASGVDMMCYLRDKKNPTGMMAAGICSQRTHMEIYHSAGLTIGVPNEVLMLTAMAAIDGAEMEIRKMDGADSLDEKLESILRTIADNEDDDPQIH